ncbi:MAG: hypothetical protein AAGI30_02620 [Planctomycetota bacterium]
MHAVALGRSQTPNRRAFRVVLRFAAGLSVAVHLALIVWFALFGVAEPAQLGRAAPPPAEAAVLVEQPLEQAVFTELSLDLPQVTAGDIGDVRVQAELSELSLESLPNLSSELAPGSTGEGDADGLDGGGAGSGGSASFFGVEASGQRFAFILDFSSSMRSNGRIETLRVELAESLDSLHPGAEFRVVLFADEEDAFDITGGDWQPANDRARSEALRFVNRRDPGGGTEPLPAFEQVFAVRPAPDAVYFMTDGEFRVSGESGVVAAASALLRVRRDARARSVIHTLLLGHRTNDTERAMRLIAQETGGRFQAVGSGSR